MKISPCFFVGIAIGFLGAKALANATGPNFSNLPGGGTTTPPPLTPEQTAQMQAQGIGAYYTDYAQHPGYPWPNRGRCFIPSVTRHNMTA